jgi:hypothetical protein
MTLHETILNLEYYNRWRSGEKIEMPDPKDLTATIKSAIKHLKAYENSNRTIN